MDALRLVQSTSLSLLVQQEIMRLILSGEIASGEWLNESALSQRFGVSRGPVREAFRSLEEMGFLRQEKNIGAFVREITAGEADQIYELREVLDALIARKAAALATPEQIAMLRATLDDMNRAVAEMDVATYYPINLRFHDLLAQYAGNAKLTAIYRRLMNELHIFRLRGLGKIGGLQKSLHEHRAILKAIEAGDAEAAGQTAKAHVISSRRRVPKASAER
jgi:phosphonate utilization transcriptional regulator